jgi:hypothetical protein
MMELGSTHVPSLENDIPKLCVVQSGLVNALYFTVNDTMCDIRNSIPGSTPVAPLAHVDVGLLVHQVGKPTPPSLDGGQGEHDLLTPIDVRVEHTKNVLERLARNERLPTPASPQLHSPLPKP